MIADRKSVQCKVLWKKSNTFHIYKDIIYGDKIFKDQRNLRSKLLETNFLSEVFDYDEFFYYKSTYEFVIHYFLEVQ